MVFLSFLLESLYCSLLFTVFGSFINQLLLTISFSDFGSVISLMRLYHVVLLLSKCLVNSCDFNVYLNVPFVQKKMKLCCMKFWDLPKGFEIEKVVKLKIQKQQNSHTILVPQYPLLTKC